jgi:aminoglycoside phosphotransferase family enzyme
MRRLPDDRLLNHLLRIGGVSPQAIDKIARRLATFHRAASIAKGSRYGSAVAISPMVLGNLDECRPAIRVTVEDRVFDPIQSYLSGFISAHRELLDDRTRQGRDARRTRRLALRADMRERGDRRVRLPRVR